jgi:hypothetical protein
MRLAFWMASMALLAGRIVSAGAAYAEIPARFLCAPAQADPSTSDSYPYPADAHGRGSKSDKFAWDGLGCGDAGGFDWGALDARSGEAMLRQITGSFAKKLDAHAYAPGATKTGDEIGRANDVWTAGARRATR